MGRIKQYLMESEYSNLLYEHVEDKFVCSGHIDDYAITNFISSTGYSDICTYCEETTKVLPVKELVNFINRGLTAFYEDPANSMGYDSSEGGYLGTTYEIEELLDEVIGLEIDNPNLQDDIVNSFNNTPWCEIDPYGDTEKDYLSYNWDYFKDVIKHKSRYLFSQTTQLSENYLHINKNPFEILHEVGRRIEKLNMFSWVRKDTLLYRCRQHERLNEIKDAKDIASPPSQHANISNRMSPAGISMFYCAFDNGTAAKETVDLGDTSKPFYTIGQFKPNEDLYLLDLSVPIQIPSIFDEKDRPEYFSKSFLRDFITDLTKGIKRDGYEHIDYVPTQVVTEYFRYPFCDLNTLKIDGIIYPSAKSKTEKSCVLFFDNKESLEKLDFVGIETHPNS